MASQAGENSQTNDHDGTVELQHTLLQLPQKKAYLHTTKVY